ncbi:MAG: PEGA domain-containing protein [Sandaracinaceae bacterium]
MRAWLALGIVALTASPALAQDAACETPECLLDAGLEARRTGDDEAAVELFRRAYERSPRPQVLAQLALAEQATGRWIDAEAHLVDALATPDEWVSGHRDVLEGALRTIRANLGQLVVESEIEGVTIRVNGRDAGTLPMAGPISVEVGTAVIEASAEGYVAVQRRTEIAAGRMSRIQIALSRELTARADDPPTETTPPPEVVRAPERDSGVSAFVVMGAVAGGAGVIAIALSIAAAVVREDAVLVWNDPARCPADGPGGRLDMCEDQHATWTTARDWMTAGFIAGGILLAASAALLVVGWIDTGSESDVQVGLSPGGLAVRGRLP